MTDVNHTPLPTGPGDDRDRLPTAPPDGDAVGDATVEAVVEQAKGVVMFCRGVGPDHAGQVLADWSRQCDVPTATVAEVLVHEICVGALPVRRPALDRDLVRWLERQLREGASGNQ